MKASDCLFPPLPRFLVGSPRDRILAALDALGRADPATLALRTELPMESLYATVTDMLRSDVLTLTEDRKGCPVLRRAS